MGINNIEALVGDEESSIKQVEIRVSYNAVNGVWSAAVFEDGWSKYFSTFTDEEALWSFIRGHCVEVSN